MKTTSAALLNTRYTFEAALQSEYFAYYRAKEWCATKQLHVYFYVSDSPSGVLLAATAKDTPENRALATAALERKLSRPV